MSASQPFASHAGDVWFPLIEACCMREALHDCRGPVRAQTSHLTVSVGHRASTDGIKVG